MAKTTRRPSIMRVDANIWDILRDFSQWTTMGAVPHVGMADKLWIAVFWSIVFVVCFFVMCYLIYTSIHKYLQHPVTVTARVVSGSQAFPCLTICSNNAWKLSGIAGTPLEGLVSHRRFFSLLTMRLLNCDVVTLKNIHQ